MTSPDELLAAARSLAVDGWTAEAMHALAEAGVDVLLLKGPVLGHWLYPGEVRSYGDADLLAARASLPAAEDVLRRLGYALRDPEGERRLISGPHAQTWLRRADGAVIDLHHTLPGDVPHGELVWPALWADAGVLAVGGRDVAVPAPRARLVIVALHAAHHSTTRPLEDLRRAALHASGEDWQDAADLASRILCLPRFADGLALLPESRAVAARLRLAPPETLRALERERLAAGFERLARAHGLRERAGIVRSELLPSAEFLRWWAPWTRRSRPALAAGYAYRLAWLVLRAVPGWRAWRRARRAP